MAASDAEGLLIDERRETIKVAARDQGSTIGETENTTAGQTVPVAKIFARTFLFLLALGSMMFAKVSFVSLAHDIKNQSELSDECPKAQAYWRMYWIVIIPKGFGVLRCFWHVFRKPGSKFPWPKSVIFWKPMLYALLESSFVSLFAFYVAAELENSAIVIAVQQGLFIWTAFDLVKTHWGQRMLVDTRDGCCRRFTDTLTSKVMVLDIVAIVFQLGAIGGLSAVAVISQEIDEERRITISIITVATAIGLSIIWYVKVQSRFLTDNANEAKDATYSAGAREQARIRKRWKMGIVTGLWSMVFTTGAILIAISLSVSPNCLGPGIRHIANNSFFINIGASFLSYILAIISCVSKKQRSTLVPPLVLATMLTEILLLSSCYSPWLENVFHKMGFNIACTVVPKETIVVAVLSLLLIIAQFICSLDHILKQKMLPLIKEENLFSQPFYSSVFPEQFLVLNRKVVIGKRKVELQEDLGKRRKCRVDICTTMYQEKKHEQEQLVKSLKEVYQQSLKHNEEARDETKKHWRETEYEAHIFFDGGAKDGQVRKYAKTLMDLLGDYSNQQPRYTEMPFGLQAKVLLHGNKNLHVYLKDNNKVKNKKRWSQVMYMSYVTSRCGLSELPPKVEEPIAETDDVEMENRFILTTDGDVEFRYEDIECLLDMLQADLDVAGVCARTHPIGSGPLVWYQKFDYAIGHWFQKAAEHVLGTVTCCPGCFSLFRVIAIGNNGKETERRQEGKKQEAVLEIYRTKVEKADEFLKKDMGEDRWLSTLLVESGQRLEYCAGAHIKTYCPDSFEEFFKQRRRWISSTMVNLFQLCSNGSQIAKDNDSVSFLFILYQAIMFFASIITPSTVILIISYGLTVTYDANEVAVLIVLLLISIGYGAVCLAELSQKIQLNIAKVLTAVFIFVMGAVIIGLLIQSIRAFRGFGDLNSVPPNNSSTPSPKPIHVSDIPISTYYILGLAGVYIVGAILHLSECKCLMQAVWYLFCLPSGYLVLVIYAVCNLHQEGWGTRENEDEKKKDDTIWSLIKTKFNALRTWCRGTEGDKDGKNSDSNHDENKPSSEEDTFSITIDEELGKRTKEEYAYWKFLVYERLQPEAPKSDSPEKSKLQEELQKLRNHMVVLFLVANCLWILLISSIANHSELIVKGNNLLGLVFLGLYGFVTAVQFLTLIYHRIITFVHWFARSHKNNEYQILKVDGENLDHTNTGHDQEAGSTLSS